MDVNLKTRRRVRLEGMVFVLLFLTVIGLLSWLSTRYGFEADWTRGNRNTLSAASQKLLERLEGPIEMTAYVSSSPTLRQRIEDVVDRYRRFRGSITVQWVNAETQPARVRQAGITTDGTLIVSYGGRREKVQYPPSEEKITNALQRAARAGSQWVVFLEGHGERDPSGQANFDLGKWGRQLRDKGLKVKALNLAEAHAIPDNTAAVVIAGPQVQVLPGEVKRLQAYIKGGGNLLWLADPGVLHGLGPLAKQLGVTFLPGTVVDTTAQLMGISDPSIAVVTRYGDSPVTRDFNLVTVFPQARALRVKPVKGWHSSVLLQTSAGSWAETGKLQGTVAFDQGSDIKGPLTIGVALSRRHGGPGADAAAQQAGQGRAGAGDGQRVVVIGNGDFLANSYLGNGGNLALGMNIINWLTSEDVFINIPPKAAPDTHLTLTQDQASVLGFVFLILMPGLMIGGGGWIWWRRRR